MTKQIYVADFTAGVANMATVPVEHKTDKFYHVGIDGEFEIVSGAFVSKRISVNAPNVFEDELDAWRWLHGKAQEYRQECYKEYVDAGTQEEKISACIMKKQGQP